MKEEIEIIEGYRDELAAPLAEMFNSWDELWPWGITHGVPYTAERVRKWLSPMRAIAILIAMDREQGKPVGFLSLLSHWRDPEAAYIGLLGVSPEVLGKKFGKHLLLRSLTIATQKGYRRVDLHTWAGNLRAVPLYKKLGFMWNPEGEGVYLQNYIPAILSHPLCAPFFKTHPDWYALQRRELELAPDEMREEGMDLFIYSFVAGEDSLRVLVDRYARGITGVERVLGEERLRIEACLSEHLTICGLPGEYTLRMENGTSEELALTVSLEGFAGLRFDREPEPRLKVPAGGSAALTVPFRLDTSVPLYRKELKCPAIVATLTLEAEGEEQEFALATGLKIKPAAEIHTRFGECRALPGGRTTLPITTMSNLSTALRGKIRFEPPDHPITIAPIEREIELPPEGPAGVTVELALPEELAPGAYDLWAVLQLEKAGGDSDGDGDRDRDEDEDEDEDLTLTTPRFRIPVFCIPEGAVAVGEDDRKREVLVVSADYTARLAREGGRVKITVPIHSTPHPEINLETEIGPPFGLDPSRYAEREVKVERTASSTTVSLFASHPQRPLRLETRLIFTHNSPVIRQETWVTNHGEADQTFQLRITGYSGEFGLTRGRAVIPLASGIVQDRISSILAAYPAIPGDPQAFSEGWIAVDGESFASGQVWETSGAGLEEIRISHGRIGRLSYRPVTLKGGERRCLSRIWHLTRAEGWREVRRLWQREVARCFPLESELASAAVTDPDPILRIAPPPVILPHRRATTIDFKFHYSAMAPLSGRFSIDPPEGWSATLSPGKGKKGDTKLMLSEITRENLPSLRLTFAPRPGEAVPDRFGLFKGEVRWETPVQVRQPFTLLLLGSSKAEVELEEGEEGGLSIFRVRNGLLEFAVSPEYGGCLFSLKNRHSTELLCSAFPNPKPKVFFQNYWGGVQPLVGGVDEDITQVKTNTEKMEARACTQGGVWKGVEVRWKGELEPHCRGVEFILRYLTAPGSPLILIDWTIRNPTTAPLRLIPALSADVAFDGDLADSVLQARWGGALTDVRRGAPFTIFSPEANFAWLRRELKEVEADQNQKLRPGEGVAFLSPGTAPKMVVVYLDEGCWLIRLEPALWLKPEEERLLRSCIVVDPADSTVLEEVQQLLEEL